MTVLDHLAIAVPDLEEAMRLYQAVLGVEPSPPRALPAHGVRVSMVQLENVRLELMEPLKREEPARPGGAESDADKTDKTDRADPNSGNTSPISKFLSRHPAGGLHHYCLRVADVEQESQRLASQGLRIVSKGIGEHGGPVLFLHPKDFCGGLLELAEEL